MPPPTGSLQSQMSVAEKERLLLEVAPPRTDEAADHNA